jgi:hypothetical protein
MASAAQTGSSPVANATTLRIRPAPAAIRATRREIPDGPVEPAAATMPAVSAPSNVARTWGRAPLSAAPAISPAVR